MELDRELVFQLVISAGAILLFVVAATVVSSSFGAGNDGITIGPTGGIALVVVLVVFVVLMALAGLWLERQEFDS